MDPITTAIVAGLAKLAEPAVKDSYEALKNLIKRKFGSQSKVTAAVEELEAKPDSGNRVGMLQERVEETKAAQDEELIRAAQALTEQVEAQPGGREIVQKVQQYVKGDRNIFSGTGNVTVHERPEGS